MSTPATTRRKPTRESVTTINQDGSRFFLHPSDVGGPYTLARRGVAALLIFIYALLPWIPIGGHPAVFLDVINRRFHLFGLTFATQDSYLLFFFITGLGFSLFVVTALFGRIWCGWACPQTVFLEHVYRRIERWIEGDAPARRKLDKADWDSLKTIKRVAKHGLFIAVSFIIAHVFLAYFVSLPQLWRWMTTSPLEHWGAFVFVIIATATLYFNFSWFREQLCLVICPYGRLQSALIDDDSIVIGYDEKRGEPRGPATKEGIGDCINCNRCVQVCPTGIDIRQGLQIECIGCANCIDACDAIMAKVGRPKGLVRYDSMNGLAGQRRRILRPRLALYAALMALGAGAALFAASQLGSASMNIVRMAGAPYIINDDDLRNQYMVRLINKDDVPRAFTVEAFAEGQTLEVIGFAEPVTVEPGGEEVRPLVIRVPRSAYQGKFEMTLRLIGEDGKAIAQRTAEFLGPDPAYLNRNTSS
ncbi:MAG: cytochrome c oxidase accessory protein CcoG [Puniceicoccales bacterium]